MEKRFFAFDVDGTLITSQGKVQPFVAELFQSIYKKYDDPTVMFVSGADVQKIKDSIKLIETQAGLKIKNPYIIALTGAVILKPDNTLFCAPTFMDENICNEMEEITYTCEKYAYIAYATDEGNFFVDYRKEQQDNHWLSAEEVVEVAYKLARFSIQPIEKAKLLDLQKNHKVRSAWILIADKEKNLQVYENLLKWTKNYDDLNISGGFDMCVGFSSKLQAIRKVCGSDLENLVYFGDGENDLELLALGKMGLIKGSVGVGSKVEVLKSADLAVPYFNQFVVDYALGELKEKQSACEFEVEGKKTRLNCTPNTIRATKEKIKDYAIENAVNFQKLKKTFY